jgi:hypothetical protein
VIVFVSAFIELRVPVICPLAFVIPAGCVTAFPAPLAASVTVAPLTGFAYASFTVTVIVDALAPLLAVIELGAAATSDRLALGAPAAAVAANVTGLPVSVPDVAVSVFDPAAVPWVQEVTAAIPPAFVSTGVVGFTVPPPNPTANVTETPSTGFPYGSVTRTAGGIGTGVLTGAVWLLPTLIAIWLAGAGVTTTLAVCVTVTVPFTVAVIVFVSALVELTVPVICPLALVGPAGCVTAFPAPLAASVTVAPFTGFPDPSFTVTVIVDALAPLLTMIELGAAATSDWLALGTAVPVAVKVTGLPVKAPAVAVRVFGPAVPSVQEVTAAMPFAFVKTGVVGVTVPPPEATAKVTLAPET